jgi:hypothetical protein
LPAPTTGILDGFNRSTGLGANWGQSVQGNLGTFGGGGNLTIIGNTVVGSALGQLARQEGWWTPSTFGPDTEVYATLTSFPTGPTGALGLYARIGSPNVNFTANGYMAYWLWNGASSASQLIFYNFLGGSVTQIGATVTLGTMLALGDKMWFTCAGSTLSGYRSIGGGAFTLEGQVTDTNHASAGYVGILIEGNCAADDFGAGVPVPSAIKTIEGVSRASVATMGGLTFGSVKTVAGLA